MNIQELVLGLLKPVRKASDGKRKPMKIQSLIFSKDKFKSAEEAKTWAANHNFTASGVDETGDSFRLRQESPGKFDKMRTIELTSGVKAVVGKCVVGKSGGLTSSQVHVKTPEMEIPAEHKQPVKLAKDGLLRPNKTAAELHNGIIIQAANIGGTVKTGDKSGSKVDPNDGKGEPSTERFVFGPMNFDIDKARKMGGLEANGEVAVSPDWSHGINVDTDAALESTSTNPVMVAQIPTTNGIEHLLVDGHHRMHKAMHEGAEKLPAHIFSPEESMEFMSTHPDLKGQMVENMKKAKPLTSTGNPGDDKPAGDPEKGREDVANKTPEQIDTETADAWKARAIAAFEEGDEINAALYAHEALEHASGAHDEGKTVARVEQELEAAGVLKDNDDVKKYLGFDNSKARSSGGQGDNELQGLYDMQDLVQGTDWELAHNTTEQHTAQEMAQAKLDDDPLHYAKLIHAEDGVDWNTGWGLDGAKKGLNIDLGSGPNREPGYLGFDLIKHDHGTTVHDLHMGIPLPDGSAKQVLLRNSLAYMDELSKDPKPLLSEIQRVLMPGGQFVYEGPDQIQNQPEWLKETWNEKFQHQEDRADASTALQAPPEDERSVASKLVKAAFGIRKIEGQPFFRQEFARVAQPDAATANDSEPRIGIAQYDSLPADALLAMDALGYYWSDATSSGRGNREHGYPSQGALVDNQRDKESAEKGGPGSGPQGGQADRDRKSNERQLQMLASQAGKDKERYERARKAFEGKTIPICKANKAKQIVLGVVLAPNEEDLQNDWMRAEEIEKTAHFWMMNGATVGKDHEQKAKAVPVESYIAPVDFEYDGQYGNQTVKKGSWILAVKINDPEDWAKVESGEYTGFSVGGWGQRT